VYELNQVDGGIVASLPRVDAALRYLPEEGATALSRGHLTLLRAELDARIALWQRRQAEQPMERPAAPTLATPGRHSSSDANGSHSIAGAAAAAPSHISLACEAFCTSQAESAS
jgi:hypothetical protein